MVLGPFRHPLARRYAALFVVFAILLRHNGLLCLFYLPSFYTVLPRRLYATQACYENNAYASHMQVPRQHNPETKARFYCGTRNLYSAKHRQSRNRRTTPAISPSTSGRLASLRPISMYTKFSGEPSSSPRILFARCQSCGFCFLEYTSRTSGAHVSDLRASCRCQEVDVNDGDVYDVPREAKITY